MSLTSAIASATAQTTSQQSYTPDSSPQESANDIICFACGTYCFRDSWMKHRDYYDEAMGQPVRIIHILSQTREWKLFFRKDPENVTNFSSL